MQTQNAMQTAPVSRIFPKLALPSVVAMVSAGVSNLAATLFAAPFGKEWVAALGIVFSALTLLQAVGYTVALGGATLFSPAFAQSAEHSAPIAAVTVWEDLILGGILGGIGFLLTTPIMKFLGATPTLLSLCTAYGKPLFLSAPLVCANYAFGNLLRCVNRSVAAMVGLTVGAVTTVALTPLCFYGFSWGLSGAGWSFLAGQGLSFFILLLCYRNTPPFSFSFSREHLFLFVKIPYYGISSLIRQGFSFVSLLVLNRLARKYGTQTLAALSVCSRIFGLCYSALLGWGQGFAPLGGYAFGQKNGNRLNSALAFGIKTAVISMSIFSVGICLYAFTAPPLVRIGLLSSALVLPLVPPGVFATMGYQVIQKPVIATLLSCLRQGICLIPLLLVLPRLWGAKGLLVATALADALTFVICLFPLKALKHRFACFSQQEVL